MVKDLVNFVNVSLRVLTRLRESYYFGVRVKVGG